MASTTADSTNSKGFKQVRADELRNDAVKNVPAGDNFPKEERSGQFVAMTARDRLEAAKRKKIADDVTLDWNEATAIVSYFSNDPTLAGVQPTERGGEFRYEVKIKTVIGTKIPNHKGKVTCSPLMISVVVDSVVKLTGLYVSLSADQSTFILSIPREGRCDVPMTPLGDKSYVTRFSSVPATVPDCGPAIKPSAKPAAHAAEPAAAKTPCDAATYLLVAQDMLKK